MIRKPVLNCQSVSSDFYLGKWPSTLELWISEQVSKSATPTSHNKVSTATISHWIFNGKFVALLQCDVRQFRNAFSMWNFSSAKKNVEYEFSMANLSHFSSAMCDSFVMLFQWGIFLVPRKTLNMNFQWQICGTSPGRCATFSQCFFNVLILFD